MSVKPGKWFKIEIMFTGDAIVISQPKISFKMVTKSRFRTSAFRKRARF